MRPNIYTTDDYRTAKLLRTYHQHDERGAPWALLLLLCSLALSLWGWAWLLIPPDDFTDSGVNCIDDCLQIQDEADETISQERN